MPGISLTFDHYSGDLHVLAVTMTGWIFRLRFPVPGVFYSSTLPYDWAQEHKIELFSRDESSSAHSHEASTLSAANSAQSRSPTLLHVVEAGLVLIACADGTLLKVHQNRSQEGDGRFVGPWRETSLKSSTFLSALTKFFSRSAQSPAAASGTAVEDVPEHSRSAATHVVALDTILRDDASALAFSLSRDRKIRVWDLVADACLLTAELPSEMLYADKSTQDGSRIQLASPLASLPPLGTQGGSRPLCRIISSQGGAVDGRYSSYLLVYVPAPLPLGSFFALYGIEFSDGAARTRTVTVSSERTAPASSNAGGVAELALLWQQSCDEETQGLQAELRDISVTMGPGDAESWTLWCLWDRTGQSAVKETSIDFSSVPRSSNVETEMWRTIDSGEVASAYTPLRGSAIDALLDLEPGRSQMQIAQEVAQVYIDRIMEAGRFNRSSLMWALDTYSSSLGATLHATGRNIPPTLAKAADHSSLDERIVHTVGAGVEIEADAETGAARIEKYQYDLRREWQKFVGLLGEADAHGRWPLAFVQPAFMEEDEERPTSQAPPCIVTRDRLMVPVVEDIADSVVSLASKASAARLSKSASLHKNAAQEAELQQQLRSVSASISPDNSHLQHSLPAHVTDLCLPLATIAVNLDHQIPQRMRSQLYAEIFRTAAKPMTADITDIALEWWLSAPALDGDIEASQSQLARSLEDLSRGTTPEELESALWFLTDLLTHSMSDSPGSPEQGRDVATDTVLATQAGTACVADGFQRSLRGHLALSKALLLLALCIHISGLQVDAEDSAQTTCDLTAWVNVTPRLLARLVSTAHQFHVLTNFFTFSGLAELSVNSRMVKGEEPDSQEKMTRQLGALSVTGSASGVGGEVYGSADTLAHFCLLKRLFSKVTMLAQPDRQSIYDESTKSALSIQSAVQRLFLSLALSSPTPREDRSSTFSPPLAKLAQRLLAYGHAAAVQYLAQNFPPTAAIHFLSGRALLQQQAWSSAAQAFLQASAGVAVLSQQGRDASETDALMLRAVIPVVGSAIDSLPSDHSMRSPPSVVMTTYWRHIADLFEAVEADEQTAQFAQLAIEAAQSEEQESLAILGSATIRDMYFRLFRAHLSLGHFEDCYRVITDSPVGSLRRDCLRMLIPSMCESGCESQLLDFNFAGLQQEVERNLSFKARNSDPTANPPYFYILYSYHMRRADYKSAGAVMYQQAHKLADLHHRIAAPSMAVRSKGSSLAFETVDRFVELSVLQARSLLAAINALALLDVDNAWFADAVTASTGNTASLADDEESRGLGQTRVCGSKKLSSYIPAQHWQSGSKEIRIVQQDDIRHEYRLVLARLEVVQLYPELANAGMTLNPADIVALLVRNGQYDKALTAARGLNIDPSSIFASLALKCAAAEFLQRHRQRLDRALLRSQDPDGTNAEAHALLQTMASEASGDEDVVDRDFDDDEHLGEAVGDVAASWAFLRTCERTSGWTGSVADRAWRYLRLNLEIEDLRGVHNGWKHRIVVLERILGLRSSESDEERIEAPKWLIEWFEDHQPHLLLQAYMKADLVDLALGTAISWVQKQTQEITRAAALGRPNGSASSQRGAYVPYTILESLLHRAIDPDARPSGATKSAAKTRSLADELKKELVEKRLGLLDKKWLEEKRWMQSRAPVMGTRRGEMEMQS
ncbi:unnamed protein product [Parajaminaea phylloscopi]